MNRAKQAALRLLRPNKVITIILVPVSTVMLVLIFAKNSPDSPFAYASYMISAYTLIVLASYIPHAVSRGKSLIYGNKYSGRYLTDMPLRGRISLYTSLGINLLYAAFKILAGVYYASYWFAAEAIYYIALCSVRFFLLKHMRKGSGGLKKEYEVYRFCGFLLFALNATLTGVVYHMIHGKTSTAYSEIFVITVAAYTFYSLILSIVSIFTYRKTNSPMLSATKVIQLSQALVALFALQNAMLATFGGEKEPYQNLMSNAVGACVCLSIFCMAVIMVAQANAALKK